MAKSGRGKSTPSTSANKRKKAASWSPEKYKLAVSGVPGDSVDSVVPGLRSVATGFTADAGFDLRHVGEWSASKKRKVRETYEKMHNLFAQSRRIVRPRSKQNLRTLQASFHGDIPTRTFKVAFVPYTPPKLLPGVKPVKPRIRYTKRGVVFDQGSHWNHYEAFDKTLLARDPHAEIDRVMALLPGARLFVIKNGQFQTLNGKSAGLIAQQVLQYMAQYDGKTPLPRGSGNRRKGDGPEWHHWKYWLDGIYGYGFPKGQSTHQMQQQITAGMKEAKRRRKQQDAEIRQRVRKVTKGHE